MSLVQLDADMNTGEKSGSDRSMTARSLVNTVHLLVFIFDHNLALAQRCLWSDYGGFGPNSV